MDPSRVAAPTQAMAPAASQGGGRMIWPISGRWERGFAGRHKGVDVSMPVGTPVVAAMGGTVTKASGGYNGGFGNLVVISHGNGLETWYAHLSGFAVSQGASVSQGQQVARSGNTGSSTGPHLHFEVHSGSSAVNPMNYLPAR